MGSMFIEVTVGTFIFGILAEAVKRLGGQTAGEFLYKRIRTKFKKNHNKDIEQELVNAETLDEFRDILKEELGPYGVKNKEIDIMILKGVQKLSNDHDIIIDKIDRIEGLIIKLSTNILYEAQISGSEVPVELNENLFENFLLKDEKSENKINEYIKDGHYSPTLEQTLTKYEPFRQAYSHEILLVERFLRHFEENKNQMNQLAMLSDLWSILGSKSLSSNMMVSEIIIEILTKKDVSEELSLVNLLRFLHLLDTSDALDQIDEEVRKEIERSLSSEIEKAPYYTQLELAYFLMKLDNSNVQVLEYVEKALTELSNQKYSDQFVKESISINKKILTFFHNETELNINRSTKAIGSLTKRFKVRKFAKSTVLLEGQLTRTLSETNLIASNIPDVLDKESLISLKQTISDLTDTLVQNIDKDALTDKIRTQIWKIIDNCVYIVNKISITNTKQILENFEVDIAKKQGVYSEDWGEYKRKSTEEIKRTLKEIKLSKSFFKKVETEKMLKDIKGLPEPPKMKEKEENKRKENM
ncbi:MAG: hypothetical protein GOP50_07575 [Candidatus Heimdallarchaeota archaeon]|nr:hypothetical protein [Candidatus Heimdallarchaeota archaeon]